MEEWITQVMNDFGYLGIMLLIAIENIFPPIPSEIILTLGGFMTTSTKMTITGVVIFSTLGSIIGAIVLYSLGRILNRERLELLVDKYGKYLRLKKSDIEKADKWFNRRGSLTVFFCRFIPIVRSLISIPAGMAKMNMIKFFIYTTIGTAIWNIVLVNLGAIAGANWKRIVEYFEVYSHIAYAIIGVLGVAFLIWFFVFRKPREDKEEE